MRSFYLAMAVIGTVVPWLFFGPFIAANGPDLISFVAHLFVNGPAGGITADLLISSLVFWAWSYGDARNRAVSNWWVVVPATLLVGLSLSLPLYLYMREGAAQRAVA